MEENHQYEINLHWSATAGLKISASGLSSDIEVAVPTQSGDREEGLWSPELLLLGAVTSCFTTALIALAKKSGIEFGSFTCSTYGCTDAASSGEGLCDIIVKPYITVALPKQVEKALRLVEAAHHKTTTINLLKTRVHLMPHITCAKDKC